MKGVDGCAIEHGAAATEAATSAAVGLRSAELEQQVAHEMFMGRSRRSFAAMPVKYSKEVRHADSVGRGFVLEADDAVHVFHVCTPPLHSCDAISKPIGNATCIDGRELLGTRGLPAASERTSQEEEQARTEEHRRRREKARHQGPRHQDGRSRSEG